MIERWLHKLDDWGGPLVVLSLTVLLVIFFSVLIYDNKHCLKHELHGYIYIWHQIGKSGYMQPIPNEVCVLWDSDTTQTKVEDKNGRNY